MLTRKQYDLLLYIQQRIAEDGVSPSFDEMKDALDLKSKSGIHRLVIALEERGFIRRLANRARALEVVRIPEDAAGHAGRQPFRPSVIEGDRSQAPTRPAAALPVAEGNSIAIPLIGKIAAGLPIEALENHTSNIDAPTILLGPGKHFALEVEGDSMIEAGIHDGDWAIIRQTQSADNGDIVVALVDDDEATLKRFRRKGNSIALEPANADFETRIFGPDQIHVQGRLVGLMRRY